MIKIIVFLALLSLSCGKNNEDNNSLKIFESKDSLQEAVKEKNTEINSSENDSQILENEEEELEQDYSPPPPVLEPKISEVSELEILKNYKTSYLNLKIIGLDSNQQKLIIFSRYELVSTEDSNTYSTILSPEIFKAELHEDMPAISAAKIIDNNIWVSFSNGLSIIYQNNKWRKLDGGPYNNKKTVRSIYQINNQIALASSGLYLWGLETERFISNQELRDLNLTKITKLEEDTLGLVSSNLFIRLKLPEKNLSYGFALNKGDIPLSDILLRDTNLLLGTSQGILVLSKDNNPLHRIGDSYKIKELIQLPNQSRVLVRTNKGIGILKGHNLKVIEFKQEGLISSLVFYKDKIIIGTKEFGLFALTIDQLIGLIENSEPNIDNNFNQTYENACIASEKALENKTFSGSISKAIVDSGTYTFIDQRQVCPYGAGRMFADGSLLLLSGNNIKKISNNTLREIKLPENLKSSDVVSITESSKNLIYLGTKSGLFYLNDKEPNNNWIHEKSSKELSEDIITDFLFDKQNNLWVSTRIKKIENQEDIVNLNYKPLHIKTAAHIENESGWAHFGSANGISSRGISTLRERDGNIFIGSSDGLSVIKKDSSITLFSRPSGLQKNIVENFILDQNNRIWITSSFFHSGISFIEGESMYESEKKDGLLSDRIEKIGMDSNHRVWLVDTSGRTQVISESLLRSFSKKSYFHENRGEIKNFIP